MGSEGTKKSAAINALACLVKSGEERRLLRLRGSFLCRDFLRLVAEAFAFNDFTVALSSATCLVSAAIVVAVATTRRLLASSKRPGTTC